MEEKLDKRPEQFTTSAWWTDMMVGSHGGDIGEAFMMLAAMALCLPGMLCYFMDCLAYPYIFVQQKIWDIKHKNDKNKT